MGAGELNKALIIGLGIYEMKEQFYEKSTCYFNEKQERLISHGQSKYHTTYKYKMILTFI